jgi:hypothetical protein
VQLFDQLFIELLVLFLEVFQAVPDLWIKKIHQIKELSHVVIQGRLQMSMRYWEECTTNLTHPCHNNAMNAVQFIQFSEEQTAVTFHLKRDKL